ncbi:double-stranded RNA-binding protein Staufen homolog 2 isoform X2 [Zerene cesonia]|uniref:double-stranded RNA-binding protein Staufen homolog 2 isoform X2 n=1 Tax=Zerene cesonia TaxID=33412 RepID=UPI0018E504EB|nr:double-stranded RNA-binding protein Staufen homolog 2 isoform X2 [Zerene cesonia]
MMHHPNMHHQPMSGHPPQHLPGHQGMPAHHQMPPHQMHSHRENRHVTLTRVPLGPSAGGNMGAHGQMSGMGSMPVHHPPSQRPPHPIRAMHHPPAQHHNVPPQTRPLRRPYAMNSGYGPAGAPVPPYAHAPPAHAHADAAHNAHTAHNTHQTTGLCRPPSPIRPLQTKLTPDFVTPIPPSTLSSVEPAQSEDNKAVPSAGADADGDKDAQAQAQAAAGEGEAARPPAAANSKEKTPMCLVNELARYNKIKHQYRLTSETGPAHKKVFTVTLRLGDTEEYTAEGSSIKRAQHAAASAALSGTRYPPPPPRAQPSHAAHAHHHRHAGAVMPTVELNALAMKLCQPAVYTSVPPVPARARARLPPYRLPFLPPYAPHAPHPPHPPHPPRLMEPGPPLLYRYRVCVGGRAWLGEGSTPQAARHDAAARALLDLRPHHDPPAHAHSDNAGETDADLLNSEVKSPVSLVHELALKRNLNVTFSVKSERGPPHMRVFITVCKVGEMETEGEGNGKKVSKRRAAERMLEEMRRRWPVAALRPRTLPDKRKHPPAKKKPRNLIKEGMSGGAAAEGAGGAAGAAGGAGGAADNPISRLAVARHAARARSPQYRVLEERGAARRREFLVQCDAPPHSATGLGPNKKTAKRRAAHNVLLAMEMASTGEPGAAPAGDVGANGDVKPNCEVKRKENEGSDMRQPVPGVLMVDYHARTGQPAQTNGVNVSESSATGGGGSSPGAKDQLMYLAQLLGFTVQFSDFPKRNHGEYLSLVSLSTEPPVMCHGGGASTALSHEQCARAALRALALMGLDAPATMQNMPSSGAKASVISNGISE